MDGRNSRLEGPRRFGKTSLIRAVLDAASHDGAIVIEVNFLGCVSAHDVTDRVDAAYREQLEAVVATGAAGAAGAAEADPGANGPAVRHAFFAPVELEPLPPVELGDYVVDRFQQGRRDPGEALGLLIDAAEGHPQRAM